MVSVISSLREIVAVPWRWLDQDARVHHTLRVERRLRAAQRRGEQLGPLPVVPVPVIAPDRMVMGDSAAGCDERIARGILDLLPLLNQRAMTTERVKGEIRGRTIRI